MLEVVNSPSALDFNPTASLPRQAEACHYQESVYANGVMTGTEIIRRVARDYSIHPRLLLALLEYESAWVYGTPTTQDGLYYPLGLHRIRTDRALQTVSLSRGETRHGLLRLAGRHTARADFSGWEQPAVTPS